MCGIAGIISKNQFSDQLLRNMTDSLIHRGPDDSGYEIIKSENFFTGLGQRRLSIIDLSAQGHQPMTNEDYSVWITFNGEIYNYLDLRDDLIKKGHIFRSKTDTEVIIHGYEEYGTAFFNKMNGMFAFALWDKYTETLILCRDRYGKKPLYYAQLENSIIFSSELKALCIHPDFNKNVSLRSVSLFFQYEYVPAPNTIYEKANKLPAGHYLEFSPKGISINKWWDVNLHENSLWLDCSEQEVIRVLNEKLTKAVERRLVSDVPLGVFLSGGIDSSIITALMADLVEASKIKTFSIGFNEESFDESDYASVVAKRFGTDHHTKILQANDMISILPEITSLLDEPYADASIIPTYLLSKFTREHVTVALGGDGGDELFAGYDPFLADFWANIYTKLPAFINDSLVQPLVNKMPVSDNNMSLDFKAKRFLKYVYHDPVYRNQLWLGAFNKEEQNSLFLNEINKNIGSFNPLSVLKIPEYDNSQLALAHHYQKYYLTDDILFKIDRAGMMVSLEARTPFLDVEVAEFANSLPTSFKLRNLSRKYILKKAFKNKLPHNILYRKKKGFGIPLTKWIKEDLKTEIAHYLSPDFLNKQGLFNSNYLQMIFNAHLSGKADNRKQIWSLFMFQKWYENQNM
jgi:asparagine synthase (glutamine-hydrolysing)